MTVMLTITAARPVFLLVRRSGPTGLVMPEREWIDAELDNQANAPGSESTIERRSR